MIDSGITGVMHEDLAEATRQALALDRQKVWQGSQRWSWQSAWEIFRDHLVPVV